jgi:hypothetical protein
MGMGRAYARVRRWKTPHVVVVRRSNFKVLREACQCLIGGVWQGLSRPLDTSVSDSETIPRLRLLFQVPALQARLLPVTSFLPPTPQA